MALEVIPADTTPEAARVQREIFRRMSPSQRLHQACEMSDSLQQIVAAGVRSRHPDYDDNQVRLAVIRLTLGDELFHKAYPGANVKV
jgi:hypothetical protein